MIFGNLKIHIKNTIKKKTQMTWNETIEEFFHISQILRGISRQYFRCIHEM